VIREVYGKDDFYFPLQPNVRCNSSYHEAKQAGVDIDALRYNLSLTPEQRLKKFLKALAWLELAKESRKRKPLEIENPIK